MAKTAPDQLVPDPAVAREFGVSLMALWRWSHDSDLGFPPAIKIRNRCFRSRRLLEEFKARMLEQAIAERGARARKRGKRQEA